MKKEDNRVEIGENTDRKKGDEKEKEILEEKGEEKNEGFEEEEMEEKDDEEGIGRKLQKRNLLSSIFHWAG
eukprot:15113177-Ditylum_brightwellii.AAC.1